MAFTKKSLVRRYYHGKTKSYHNIFPVIFFSCIALFPAEKPALEPFSFYICPGINLPVGESSDYYKLGGTIGLLGEYRIPKKPLYYLRAEFEYDYDPIKAKNSISILSGAAGLGIRYDISQKVSLKGYTSSGLYYGSLNKGNVSQGNLLISLGAGLYFTLGQTILGVGTSYKNYLGLYSGMNASLGLSYRLAEVEKKPKKVKEELPPKPKPLEEKPPEEPPKEIIKEKPKGVEFIEFNFENLFPVFYKFYDDHPLGKAVIRNNEDTHATDVKVSILIKQYMDAPKICKAPSEVKARESATVELYGLFTDRILEITEGTKVAAEITLEYKMNDKVFTQSKVETIRVYDRNALTWDDDRKASAFVTAKDPLVLNFSKNVASMVKGKGSTAANPNLLLAIAFHEALFLYGMNYIVDPKTPYAEFSKQNEQVDFLQFPRQSLEYRAGVCDDLSILYSALLESVGVETAFIIIPGHIFMAFSLDMMPDEARRSFLRADELIFREGKTWIPIEVTQIKGGFLEAWQEGAKEWRENLAREQVMFYSIHESWKIYEPVGLPGSGINLNLPSKETIVTKYIEEVERFINREIFPKVAEIQAKVKKTGASPKAVNELGILYAKYGLLDRAQREFERILVKEEYVPALVNMGNIFYLNNNKEKALTYYEHAYQLAPSNPKVLLCMARVNHDLENYGIVRRLYNEIKAIDPDLAQQFAYLDLKGEEANRSAEISEVKGIVIWEEE